MMCGPAIYYLLANYAAVSAIVKTGRSVNIFPEMADSTVVMGASTYPQIVYKISDANVGETYSGPTGLTMCKVNVISLALTDSELNALSFAVFCALDIEPGNYGGVQIQGIFLKESIDTVEKRPNNQNQSLFSRNQTYDVWYQLPVTV